MEENNQQSSVHSIPNPIFGDQNLVHPISNPYEKIIRIEKVAIPYAADIPGGVFPGKSIFIKLVVLEKANERRFSVDLCCGRLVHGDHRDDKALHFNPRFDSGGSWFSKPDRDIVMNSLINNVWGPEQRAKNCFVMGRPATMRILMLRDYFKVAVNGKHVCDYIHRIPLENIKCLYITGCVELSLVEFQGGNPDDSPSPSAPRASFADFDEPVCLVKPKVPTVCQLHGGFPEPRELHVIFTPRMNAAQFSFNFFAGMEYLLHVRVDFPAATSDKKGAIVRNSTQNGVWLREERRLCKFPFLPGITADIRFIAGSSNVKIIIDGTLLDVFEYREGRGCPRPLEVDKITVVGDLNVQKFELKTSKDD